MASSPAAEPAAMAGPEMIQLAALTLPQTSARIKAQTLRYCPTMDLVAAALEDESWNVWRLGGGRVFGGSGFSREPADNRAMMGAGAGGRVGISSMEWKSTGMLLAIACTDNSIRLVSAYTGKVVHVLLTDPAAPENSKISCLGWNVNLTDPKSLSQRLDTIKSNDPLDELFGPAAAASSANALANKADLPKELALVDVEGSFPKLSTLPATGVEDDVFSSRASLDSMFHDSSSSHADTVDVLVAGFEDGAVHLKMFDSFEIGRVDVGSAFTSGKCKILRHSSHSLSSLHSLLVESDESRLSFVTLSLRFITASPLYLSLIASKSTQLQNLLRYINQVQTQLNIEWKTAHDLPSKFLRNINETLAEKWECDFVTAAYHLVVTGDCYPPLKEFLVDELGERGHKRWEKAVTNGYETIRRLVHECLLPAIERCQIVVSRLKGLSGFHKAGGVLGLNYDSLNFLDDTLDCLNLLAHKLLITVGNDLKQFIAFAKWLRLEIDIQAMDPDVSSVDDLLERQDNLEHRLVLDYISGAMSNSEVLRYIRPSPGKDQEKSNWEPEDSKVGYYNVYKDLVRNTQWQGVEQDTKLPKLEDLTAYLKKQCDAIFSQVATSLRNSILVSSPIPLPTGFSRDILDIKTLAPAREGDGLQYFRTLVVAKQNNHCGFFEYAHPTLESNVEGSQKLQQMAQDDDYNLIDVRFADPTTIMTLRGNKTEVQVESWDYSNLDELTTEVKHVFDLTQETCRPIRLEVNGRKGRRVVCALWEDRRRYTIFDMDSAIDGDGEEEQEQGDELAGRDIESGEDAMQQD